MSSSLLQKMIKENQDYDAIIKNKTFGQGTEQEESDSYTEQSQKEAAAIRAVKVKVNQALGERILTESKSEDFKMLMRNTIDKLLTEEIPNITIARKRALTSNIMDDILGFGPIQNLLEDPDITEIMVSRWDKIYIEKGGRLVLEPECKFNNDEHLRGVIEKIVQPIGRRIDESEPLVDARLPDGSRVNATVPPISPDGCTLTIRKFSDDKLTGEDYLNFGSLDENMLKFLELVVKSRCNIIVSGGTGSGKTTLLNMLSNFVPPWESIVTVEDSCELQLYQDNVRRLESRPASAEGKGEVSIRRLVVNTLRMRPDRIIVGEIRDGTVVDMFRAMSSGHDGSLTTIHANSPKNLVEATLPILFGMSDMEFTEEAQKTQITSAVDLIVQISRLRDGSRKITNITHVVGLGKDGASKLKLKNCDDDKIYLQDIYRFKEVGIDEQTGKIVGKYIATGYAPKEILSKIKSSGIDVPMEIFEKTES